MPKRHHEEPSPVTGDSLSPRADYPAPSSVDGAFHSPKYTETSEDSAPRKTVMKCSLPPHATTLSFATFEDFDVHYAKVHANRCPECRKNLPTEHFLGLHIEENHDPLADARRARGEKTYRCFVEDCDKVCIDPHKRQMHLTDKHLFPKNYDFLIVNTGIDKKSSMLRSKPRHHHKSTSTSTPQYSHPHQRHPESSSTTNDNKTLTPTAPTTNTDSTIAKDPHAETETSQTSPADRATDTDTEIAALTSTFNSSLSFIPPSVRFGRGGGRGRGRGGLGRS